jgi:hypothetical protein
MTKLQTTIPTDSGRSRYRSGDARWPHVGECRSASARRFATARCSRLGTALRRSRAGIAVLGMVKQRDGARVSAAGDAR